MVPAGERDVRALQFLGSQEGLPLFVLGAGANILVSDLGIRGIVVDMRRFDYCVRDGETLVVGSGTPMSVACEYAAKESLSGLEFIYGMPGSAGGSVWMNARCYETSLSERLERVRFVDEHGEKRTSVVREDEYSYKRSPFQQTRAVIVEVVCGLRSGTEREIRTAMRNRYEDRKRKGHYAAPSVGSIFKNNRRLGAPTGKILDDLGLRGYRIGGAGIAEYHANIVINIHKATAADILSVIEHAETRALDDAGLQLEREVLLVGDWPNR